ncbi:unnamed protein product [Durusdinium trenchii]|uniref:Helicase C-terminal domain-containing protein n=1 Tax=Durusdinium trenchii TaxID=1381693 RepID=A0ABP0NCC3_9DINO
MAEPSRPWVRPGNRAVLEGLKSRPELNGQEVTIQGDELRCFHTMLRAMWFSPCCEHHAAGQARESTGRWRCKVQPFGEEMKFKAENLAEAPEKEEPIDANWLRRGVQAAVKDLPEHEGQVVRVVTVDGDTGSCKCVLRSSGEAIEVPRTKLRPLAGAATGAATASPAPEVEQAKPQAKSGGSDWAAAERERRRLAEGFRSGFEEGAVVMMEGLQSMPELNGQTGLVAEKAVQIEGFLPQEPQDVGRRSRANPSTEPTELQGSAAKKRNPVDGRADCRAEWVWRLPGLDVPDISHVVNYSVGLSIDGYVHRIGRCGRAGRHGTAVTFVTDGDEKYAEPLLKVLQEARQSIPPGLAEMAKDARGSRKPKHKAP